jgi:hypothetical protein
LACADIELALHHPTISCPKVRGEGNYRYLRFSQSLYEDIDVLVACHGNHFLLLQGPRRRERNQFILQFSFSMNASPPRLMIDGATGSMLSRCSAG